MRKKIAALALGCLLVMLSLPYFMGYLAEREVMAWNNAVLNKMGFSAEVKEYQRGWLSSNVVLYLTLHQPITAIQSPGMEDSLEEKVEPKGLLLVSHLKHGPIVIDTSSTGQLEIVFGQAVIDSQLMVPEEYRTFFAQYVEQTALLNAHTIIHFDGSADSHLTSQQFVLKDPSHATTVVAWNDFASHLQLSRHLDAVNSTVQFGKLTLGIMPGGTFNLSNATITKDYTKGDYGLWFGQSTLQIPFMTVAINGKDRVVGKSLKLSSKHQEQGDVVSSIVDAQAEQFIVNERSYGPGSFQLLINNVDTQALARLTDFLHTFETQTGHWNEQDKQQVTQLLAQLLSHGFQARVDPFYLETPDGEMSVQAWVTLPQAQEADANQLLTHLSQKAEASLTIALPKVFVEGGLTLLIEKFGSTVVTDPTLPAVSPRAKAQAQIQAWLAAHWLVANRNEYTLSVVYNHGQTLINEAPLSAVPPLSLP